MAVGVGTAVGTAVGAAVGAGVATSVAVAVGVSTTTVAVAVGVVAAVAVGVSTGVLGVSVPPLPLQAEKATRGKPTASNIIRRVGRLPPMVGWGLRISSSVVKKVGVLGLKERTSALARITWRF